MKIIITPEKIKFVYPLYNIETSGEKMKYFFNLKKESKIKFNINIDPFGVNDTSLKIVLDDRKISSLFGQWFGYIAFFLNRMAAYMKTEKNGVIDLDSIAIQCCEYDISISGEEKIRSFLKELILNNYQVNDIIEKFESLVNKSTKS